MENQPLEPTFNGQRLRAIRKRRGLSAEKLARKANVTVRHVWRLEAGKRPNVAAVTLMRIALALDTTLALWPAGASWPRWTRWSRSSRYRPTCFSGGTPPPPS